MRVFKESKDPNEKTKIDGALRQAEAMRTNLAQSLLEIRNLTKSERNNNLNLLKSLVDQDMKLFQELANIYNSHVTGANLTRSLEIIRQLKVNLGNQMAISNSDKLKEDKISGLINQIKMYNSALAALYNQIDERFFE